MQFLAFFLLLALSAGALPQASDPDALAPSSTPVNSTASTHIDKRGDDPVIGLFNDKDCHGKHMGHEIPMTTDCTLFKSTALGATRFKISWHDGPSKLEFFLNDRCIRNDHYNGSLARGNGVVWQCENSYVWQNVLSFKALKE